MADVRMAPCGAIFEIEISVNTTHIINVMVMKAVAPPQPALLRGEIRFRDSRDGKKSYAKTK